MAMIRCSSLHLLTGCFALFVFAGDIAADSIADLCGNHCVSESSGSDSDHEKTPCSHCSCAVHNGSMIASSPAVQFFGGFESSEFISASDQSALAGLPVPIDHPPQIA
jgi:hypothetical protein